MTDEKHTVANPQGSKRLPRYRKLLAETELRRIFNHVVEQPLPSEFLDILRRIDARRSIEQAGQV